MLTVVVCTYHREKYIRPLLESIAANDLPKNQYEIVVVDSCPPIRKGGDLMASKAKDIFSKMHKLGMQVLYLPEPVLQGHSSKGSKLIVFRRTVTCGLLSAK